MMYLPRLCEHCLNPACVAACPSGAIYKREEDGIVLIDQDKCRGWRMCVSGCPYKKIYYNWSVRQIREVHLLLSAHRGRPADGVLGDLRRPHPLSRRGALRRRPHRGGRVERRTSRISTRRSSTIFLDPHDPEVHRAGARRRRARGLAGGGAALAGLQDGDGLEDRLPAASRIPHPADGLVRAAAVADPGGGGKPARSAIDGEMPDVQVAAHPAALPRQPADRRRRGAGGARRSNACWRCAPTCAPRPSTASSTTAIAERVGLTGAHDRGHVPHHGDRQLRGPLRHPDRAPRDRRGRLRPARLLRLLLRQRLLGRRPARSACSARSASAPRRRWRSRDDQTFRALSALLTYPTDGAAGGAPARSRGARRARAACRRRSARAIDAAARRARRRATSTTCRSATSRCSTAALAVAASVRARARRMPRSRPGDGRSQGAIRERMGLD